MPKIWILSDGRIWELSPKDSGFSVFSVISNDHRSRIGYFEDENAVEQFARDYLRLTVTEKEV